MFSLETRELVSKEGVNIGFEIRLSGELIYGTPVEKYKELKKMIQRVEQLAVSDVIAVNVLNLNRWDSLGVTQTLKPIIQINRGLLSKGRVPISVIGKKESDNYYAARDKFIQENDTELLPWHENLQSFLEKIE